jgi:hypothetical protein
MFPENFEVLKISARSTLLYAKSLKSVKASTSATLAARGRGKRGFACSRRYERTVFAKTVVDISCRPTGH